MFIKKTRMNKDDFKKRKMTARKKMIQILDKLKEPFCLKKLIYIYIKSFVFDNSYTLPLNGGFKELILGLESNFYQKRHKI